MCNNCTHEPVCGKCKATGGQVCKIKRSDFGLPWPVKG